MDIFSKYTNFLKEIISSSIYKIVRILIKPYLFDTFFLINKHDMLWNDERDGFPALFI